MKYELVLDGDLALPVKLLEFRKGILYRAAPADRDETKWFYVNTGRNRHFVRLTLDNGMVLVV